jgi:hypothetical protein
MDYTFPFRILLFGEEKNMLEDGKSGVKVVLFGQIL